MTPAPNTDVDMKWPYIETIGLEVSFPKHGAPYVTWHRIRKGLNQYRYGIAHKLGLSLIAARGLEADRLEKLLSQMAREYGKVGTWPDYWKPKKRGKVKR